MTGLTEADTCRKYVLPKLMSAGWDNEPHSFMEQRTFTDGRIIVAGGKVRRGKQKRADYLLRFTRDYLIAVIEAKANYKRAGEGLQQAKKYAEILGLKFAYSTNGTAIIEFDFITGKETELDAFPSPDDLWRRLRKAQNLTDEQAGRLLSPYYLEAGRRPRYYQEIPINRAVQAVLQGKKRILIKMTTGTGKTLVAFQICWKLRSSRWNATGAYRRPRILYLADQISDDFRLKHAMIWYCSKNHVSVRISHPLRGRARFDLKRFDLHSISEEPGSFGYWQEILNSISA